ncbi:MAG: carbohydrate-binding protein [Oligoflexales bacterium]
MSTEKREEVLRRLLDPKLENGIGFNLMRITLGTSDFTAREFYTYNDKPKGQTDLNLDNFSIQKDIDYGIIDVLKQAIQINPDLRLIAAPWSPPAWMKDNDELTGGGNFLTQYIAIYATYLRKAVQAYAELGIPIYAMSMQNEPNLPTEYPSCIMSAEQQRQLAVALRNELDENSLNTKLLVWDFNVEIPDDLSFNYISTIYKHTAAFDSVIGAAYHGYWGDPSGMSRLHDSFPNKEIWFTEKSLWGVKGMEELASYLRNWSTSYIGWVTMLDSNIQPEKWSGTPGPSLLIQDANAPDNYWVTGEFFMLGQYSRFVKRGSKRIDSSGGIPNTLTHIAFSNPDTQTALVVMNQSAESQNFIIKSSHTNCIASVMVPGKGMGTYTWPSTGCPVCSPGGNDDSNNDDEGRVPYAVHTLPGKIEAEAFDIGTAIDPAYLDKDPENRGSEYSTVIRPNEGVDIDRSTDIGGAYHVGWVEEGEWLLYTLDSVPPGNYLLQLRLSSLAGGGTIRISLEDKVLGELNVPSTGDWKNFQTISSSVVIRENPGKNLRVEFTKGEVNLNWLEFTRQ